MSPWQYTIFIVYKIRCCVIDWQVIFMCCDSKTSVSGVFAWHLNFVCGVSFFASLLMRTTLLWGMTLCWLVFCYRRFEGICRLPATYSSSTSLKMGAAMYTETSLTIHRLTRYYIPGFCNIDIDFNLSCYALFYFFIYFCVCRKYFGGTVDFHA